MAVAVENLRIGIILCLRRWRAPASLVRIHPLHELGESARRRVVEPSALLHRQRLIVELCSQSLLLRVDVGDGAVQQIQTGLQLRQLVLGHRRRLTHRS